MLLGKSRAAPAGRVCCLSRPRRTPSDAAGSRHMIYVSIRICGSLYYNIFPIFFLVHCRHMLDVMLPAIRYTLHVSMRM